MRDLAVFLQVDISTPTEIWAMNNFLREMSELAGSWEEAQWPCDEERKQLEDEARFQPRIRSCG
jgi:hypothetical protein